MDPKNQFEKYSYIENYHGSYIWIVFIIAAILLLLIIIGLSYSFYNLTIRGTKKPILTEILFNYSDVNGSGNGISIENAREMTDTVGKKLTGLGNSFEFTVSGNTRNRKGQYTVVLETQRDSTIKDSDIKIYLTRLQGNIEEELFDFVPIYSELEDIVIEGGTYKKLYSVTLPPSNEDFSQDYVLRMWIRDGALDTDYFGKRYSIKVNVLAEEVGE